MRIVSTGPGPSDWTVLAYWLGAERPVFRGDIFECCRFAAKDKE